MKSTPRATRHAPRAARLCESTQAARDKAAYEASFGPFYRVEQLILTTTPRAASNFTTPGGLPAVVTDANIRLLFDMQELVDSISGAGGKGRGTLLGSQCELLVTGSSCLGAARDCSWLSMPRARLTLCFPSHTPTAAYTAPGGAQANATLASVCFKPFGSACATQSILQYWRMDRELYRREAAKGPYSANKLSPDYCFGHWWAGARAARRKEGCLCRPGLCLVWAVEGLQCQPWAGSANRRSRDSTTRTAGATPHAQPPAPAPAQHLLTCS